jgi:hypothetical protein
MMKVPCKCERNGHPVSYIETVDMIADYVSIVCGIRGMAPYSVENTYLYGIARTFDLNRVDNHFRKAMVSVEVKLILKGLTRAYEYRNPKGKNFKIAFAMDMAIESKTISAANPKYSNHDPHPYRAEIYHERLFLVMTVGIMFLLRCSEHIESRKSTRVVPVRRNNFVFFDNSGNVIPYELIGHVMAASVTINVNFSKTDQSGYGRRIHHASQRSHPAVCVVCLLEAWFQKTRDIYGAPPYLELYQVPGFSTLKLDILHQLMHATVLSKGVHPSMIKATSHSLRYGGATMMAAAGHPQYLIAMYGGWTENSKSLRIYVKPSMAMVQLVSKRMVESISDNPSMQFLQEIRSSYSASLHG